MQFSRDLRDDVITGDITVSFRLWRRPKVGEITRAAFTTGLNHILLVAAIIALVAAAVSLVTIRSKDFAQQG